MYDDDEEEVTGSMMAVFYITFAGIAISCASSRPCTNTCIGNVSSLNRIER